jgi:hypothetical protein
MFRPLKNIHLVTLSLSVVDTREEKDCYVQSLLMVYKKFSQNKDVVSHPSRRTLIQMRNNRPFSQLVRSEKGATYCNWEYGKNSHRTAYRVLCL